VFLLTCTTHGARLIESEEIMLEELIQTSESEIERVQRLRGYL